MKRKLVGNLELLAQLNKKYFQVNVPIFVNILQEITKMRYHFHFHIIYIDVLNIQSVPYLIF